MLSNDRRSYKFMAARYEMSLSERLRNSVYLYALQDLSGCHPYLPKDPRKTLSSRSSTENEKQCR